MNDSVHLGHSHVVQPALYLPQTIFLTPKSEPYSLSTHSCRPLATTDLLSISVDLWAFLKVESYGM